ncbi:hypothetical protein M9H77_31853 [Catharanthus roseus]|uniref:Uncharacterized protein n=1 Tax=Catharanthus roseus TaxID=4058 RepID=A0ACC0A270_CATRO|nr:hypothetical protein M9H77_31853 [Catharanthus roseus]
MVPDAVDTRLDLHWIQLRGNDNTSWVTQHAIHLDAWNQWRLRVRDGPPIAAETLSYPSDEYIKWYRGITRVYIGNPANRDTRSHRYQPAGVDKRMMTIIQRCMVSIGGTLGCTVQPSRRRPREHVPDQGARGVKRGARRHPGLGARGGRPPVPPAPERNEHVDPGHAVVERGEESSSSQPIDDPVDSPNLGMPSFSLGLTPTSQPLPIGFGMSQIPPAPGLGFASFQSPHSTAYEFSGFQAPPPPGTASSSTPHQPISQASSSDKEERDDDMDGVHHLGVGHRVGKKTVRFTPSDWP